jgi:hypothetical protein
MSVDILGRLLHLRPVRVLASLRAICEKLLTLLQISDGKVNEEETLLLLAHFCRVVPMVARPHLASMIPLITARLTISNQMLAGALLCFGQMAKVSFPSC